jgi:hypothetical protein
VIRKSFGVSVMLCALAACGRNVEPGDAQYPVLSKSPQRPLDITLIQAPTVREQFSVYWYAGNFTDQTCSYSGFSSGAPARVGYSITVPLPFSASSGALHSKFAFDMYEPGLCGYKFGGLSYRSGPDAYSMPAQLIQYKDDPSLPNEASVDLWCFPVLGPSQDNWCESISAASIQSPPPATQMPRLPTREQAAAAKANGDKEPPALVGPNTRSLTIRVHDARINKP